MGVGLRVVVGWSLERQHNRRLLYRSQYSQTYVLATSFIPGEMHETHRWNYNRLSVGLLAIVGRSNDNKIVDLIKRKRVVVEHPNYDEIIDSIYRRGT